MHYLHRIAAFLVIALSLAGCQSWYPVVTMYVTPTGGSIDTTLSLANVRNLRLVQLPGDSYAIVRTNPDNEGYGVVGLDSALAPQWTYPVPFRPGYGMTPIWLSGGPAGVTLVYKEYDSRDSFSIKGILLNAENGALLQSRHLAGFSLLTHVSVTREQQLVFSPDSTFFALYRYDYSNLDDNDRKTVRLVAEMFDTKLDRIGGVNLEIPVGNDVDDADDAEPYVQSFFLSGDGYGYQVSYHETAMLRVTRIDFRSGTTEMLEKDIPGVDFDNDRKLSGTKGWTGNGGEVLVAANLIEEKALSKIELVAMNFKSGSVEFNRSIDVDPTLPHFRVRDVSRAPGREIILAVEQVIEYRVYDGPDRTTYASSLA